MFDDLDDRGLLTSMREGQRAERRAVAQRLLAAGRLCQMRMAGADEMERLNWCVDNWEAVAAEVGAELGISRNRASSQMNYGVELLERLPRVAAVFAAGDIDFRVVAAIVFRTGLITDPALLAQIDAKLAALAGGWNALSRKKVAQLVDRWVCHFDPAAQRVARSAEAERHITFGETRNGMVEFWGALRAADAAILDRTLNEIAATVCSADTRTKDQRRADALCALGAGPRKLGCDCGARDCPGASVAPSGAVVIHVLAEAATLAGGDTPGFLPGYGSLPAEAVRDLAGRARVRQLKAPWQFTAEPNYRPSAALADFVRCRDLTCRFPGCDKPAEVCDVDHTVPWGLGGPTHPSNNKLLCRLHHLLKTFWPGWTDVQYPDGTITWTSPSGRTYTTTPGGAAFFPQFATPTENLTTVAQQTDSRPGRTLMMPTRRRSRAAEREARIAWERGLNQQRWAQDPPPF
ncbi:MAG: HNH endonuclease signature motif containing protein [Mycobacterium sp.]